MVATVSLRMLRPPVPISIPPLRVSPLAPWMVMVRAGELMEVSVILPLRVNRYEPVSFKIRLLFRATGPENI